MPNVLLNAINLIISNQHNPIKQNKDGVTYAKKISSSETIIDWTKPSVQLKRKLQALSKWPGCWTHHKNNRIRIFLKLIITVTREQDKEILIYQ